MRLRIDLGALAANWRELARRVGAGALRRRRQGQCLWDRPLRSGARTVGRRGARVLRRPSERRACGAPRPAGGGSDLRAQRPRERGRSGGLRRASPRAGDRRRRGARPLVRVRCASRRDQSLGAASRHRHEPARLRVSHWVAGCDGDARGRERGRSLDKPFRLVRTPRRPHQPGANRAVRGRTLGFPTPSRLARQLVGHVPRPLRDLRPGAPRLRALRRQSRAEAAQIRCARSSP